jgi:hypothetical protein
MFITDPYFCIPDANPKNRRGNVNNCSTFLKILKKHSIPFLKNFKNYVLGSRIRDPDKLYPGSGSQIQG